MADKEYQKTIRNICIIAHVDHGKSSLSDTLMAAGGLISFDEAGIKRITDTRDDEKERGITIKSTGVALTIAHENIDYTVNLVDTPGHIDFSSEVTAAIRITDGAVILVDSVEGVSAQTETVLRQALAEKLHPMLVINKIDRYFTELKLTGEVAYQKLTSIIGKVNEMIQTYQPECPVTMNPQTGNVFFTCARYNWGFSIKSVAKMYGEKANKPHEQYMKLLWGDVFYNETTKKFSKSMDDGVRGFCHFIYNPLQNAINAMSNDYPNKDEILEKAFIRLTNQEREIMEPKEQLKRVLRRVYPLADVVVDGIVNFLPCPTDAQKVRAQVLYNGPFDHSTYESIKNCDPSGPLVIYISKMIPYMGGNFYAFGRVFSGTATTGQKVTILRENYVHGSKEDLTVNVPVQRVIKLVGAKTEPADEMKCGNTIALVGVDKYMVKSGTITTCPDKYPIHTMKFSVSPVVRVAVSPKNMADLPKFKEAMIRLTKSDPCLKVELDETGNFIVAGAGELHIEIAINDLRGFANGIDITVSKPVVPYRETVTQESSVMCLAKSPNKHNRMYAKAEPLPEELTVELDTKEYTNIQLKEVQKLLMEKYGWDKTTVGKIWGVKNGCLLLDCTKGIQFLNEIQDATLRGFEATAEKSVLCGEPLRGVIFKIYDVMLHADAIHRGASQIIPVSMRLFSACILTASPRLVEPIYQVSIQVDDDNKNKLYGVLNKRRGILTFEEQVTGMPLWNILGTLPVEESFGFDAFVKEATSGKALCSCSFSHWDQVQSDPLTPSADQTKKDACKIMLEIQKRKNEGRMNAKEEIPQLANYLDKL